MCCLLFSAVPVCSDGHAADFGFYVAAGAGSTFPHPATSWRVRIRDVLDSAQDPVFYSGGFNFSPGVSFTGAAGYQFGPLRLEAEGSYTATDLGFWNWESRDAKGEFLNQTFILQRLDAIGILLNAWYEVGTGSAFSPFVGGGVGAVYQTATESEWPVSEGSADLSEYDLLEATGLGLAYHLGAGLGMAIGAGLDLRLGYRLFTTTEIELSEEREYEVSGTTEQVSRTYVVPTVLEHRVMLGLSYRFRPCPCPDS